MYNHCKGRCKKCGHPCQQYCPCPKKRQGRPPHLTTPIPSTSLCQPTTATKSTAQNTVTTNNISDSRKETASTIDQDSCSDSQPEFHFQGQLQQIVKDLLQSDSDNSIGDDDESDRGVQRSHPSCLSERLFTKYKKHSYSS